MQWEINVVLISRQRWLSRLDAGVEGEPYEKCAKNWAKPTSRVSICYEQKLYLVLILYVQVPPHYYDKYNLAMYQTVILQGLKINTDVCSHTN